MSSRSLLGETLRTQPSPFDRGGSTNPLPFGSKSRTGKDVSSSSLLPKPCFIAFVGFHLLFSLFVIGVGGGLLRSAPKPSYSGGQEPGVIAKEHVVCARVWVGRVLG